MLDSSPDTSLSLCATHTALHPASLPRCQVTRTPRMHLRNSQGHLFDAATAALTVSACHTAAAATATVRRRLCVCCWVLQGGQAKGAGQGSSTNLFDSKTDKGSADLYFHYYGMLQHQQNMLQVRLGCVGAAAQAAERDSLRGEGPCMEAAGCPRQRQGAAGLEAIHVNSHR